MFHKFIIIFVFLQINFLKFSSTFITKCNGYATENMLPFEEFISAKNDEEASSVKQILKTVFSIDSKPTNGRIFGGIVKEEKMLLNKHTIIENCVAIKIAQNHAEEKEITNRVRIHNELQKFEEQKSEHIVGLIDYGTLTSRPVKTEDSYSVLLLELGGLNFRDHLSRKRNFDSPVDEAELINEVKAMAQPLKELHQVAAHLNFRIDKLIFVPIKLDDNKPRIVKLMDFDRAEIIHENCEPCHEIVEENVIMADTTSEIHSTLNIDKYSSPEIIMGNKQLSVKTDIWSFGISVYEAILLSKSKYVKKEQIPTVLNSIATLHRGFSIDQNGVKSDKINFNNNDWLQFSTEFKFALKIILKIWKDQPKLAILIMSLLQVNALDRTSAIGIMDFLNGNCKPWQIVKMKNSLDNFQIFPNLTIGNLEEHILALINMQKKCISCVYIGRKNNLHYLYGKMLEKIGKMFNELNAKDAQICDTKKVAF